MKSTAQAVLCAGLLAAALPASAGFVTVTGDRIFGSNNPAVDPFYIEEGVSSDGGLTFALPTNFVVLELRATEFKLPDEDEPDELEDVGTFWDMVLRDENDGKLVFGSRITMDLDEEGEINDIYRRGFTGWDVQVGWVYASAHDLRLYSAARTTGSHLLTDDPDLFDPDTVDLGTDINVEESNPFSGWYLIKTNAPNYRLMDDAIALFQGGEEDQLPYLTPGFAGFAPAPVPVPAALPLMLSGIGLLAFKGRKRRA